MTVRFKLRPGTPEAAIRKLNSAIGRLGLEQPFRFISESDNKRWLDDINRNPKSPQRHLKPDDRDLTMQELTSMFKIWTEVGTLEMDVKYDRCSPQDAAKIAAFMSAEPLLLSVHGESDFEKFTELAIEGGAAPDALQSLQRLLNIPPPPKKNPKRREMPTSGIATFSDWNGNDINVLFGAVDHPRFMKTDEYVDDAYNSIYKDPDGRPYMLLPLLELGPGQRDRLISIWKGASDIGLRAEPYTFFAAVYGVTPSDFKDVALDIGERDALYAIKKLRSMQYAYRPATTVSSQRAKLVLEPIDKKFGDEHLSIAIASFGNVLIKKFDYDPFELNKAINQDRLGELIDGVENKAKQQEVSCQPR